MKRDLELIREILLKIEAKPTIADFLSAHDLNLPNWSKEQVNYHMLLLYEAGYIQAADNSMQPGEGRTLHTHHTNAAFPTALLL